MSEGNDRSYHHGNLRLALVQAGLKLLGERSADDLGLREVARAVGVSPTAVYRHFPDKAALLDALAEAGLEQLGAAQAEAAAKAGGGWDGFNATGRAYVRFALANPALFRLIFSAVRHKAGDWDESSNSAMALLQDNAARLVAERHGEAAARIFALRAWSLVHGLALLMLDGQVPADPAAIDAAIDARGLEGVILPSP